MNSFVLIGKLMDKPQVKETTNGKKYSKIIVQDKRAYKNQNDEYDNDTYEILFWGNNLNDMEVNDILAIKGRLQSYSFEKEDNIYHNVELVGEKISLYQEVI